MNRFARLMLPALAAAAILARGTPAPAQSSQAGVPVARQTVRPLYPAIPGFYMLRAEHVQKELGLTDEQKKKLEELGKKYYEDMRQDWSGIRELSDEQRRAKYAKIREKNKKRTEALRQEIEKVLLPRQLQTLNQINLRSRGPYLLRSPQVLDRLKVSEEQKDQLRRLREKYEQELRELQKVSFEKTLEVLTPEQRKQLEEISTQGFQTVSGVQVTPKK